MVKGRSGYFFVFLFLSLVCAHAFPLSFWKDSSDDKTTPENSTVSDVSDSGSKASTNSIFPENILKAFGGESGSFLDNLKLVGLLEGKAPSSTPDGNSVSSAVASDETLDSLVPDQSDAAGTPTPTDSAVSTTTAAKHQPAFPVISMPKIPSLTKDFTDLSDFLDLTNMLSNNVTDLSNLNNLSNFNNLNFKIPSIITPTLFDIFEKVPTVVNGAAVVAKNFTNNVATSVNQATASFITAAKNWNDSKIGEEEMLKAVATLNNTLMALSYDVSKFADDTAGGFLDEGIKIVQQFINEAQQSLNIVTDPLRNFSDDLQEGIRNVGNSSSITSVFDQAKGNTNANKKARFLEGLTEYSNALFGMNAGMEIIKKGANGKEETLAGLFVGGKSPNKAINKTTVERQDAGAYDSNDAVEGVTSKISVGLGDIPVLVSGFTVNALGVQNTLLNKDCMKNLTAGTKATNKKAKTKKNAVDSGTLNVQCSDSTKFVQGLLKDGRNLIARLNFLNKVADLSDDEQSNLQSLNAKAQNIMDSVANGKATPKSFKKNVGTFGEDLIIFSNSSLKSIAQQPMKEIQKFGRILQQLGSGKILGTHDLSDIFKNMTAAMGLNDLNGISNFAELADLNKILRNAQNLTDLNELTKSTQGLADLNKMAKNVQALTEINKIAKNIQDLTGLKDLADLSKIIKNSQELTNFNKIIKNEQDIANTNAQKAVQGTGQNKTKDASEEGAEVDEAASENI